MGKKRKIKSKELTQEEIWDDSALIQSWDEAVQEYKVSLTSCLLLTWFFLTRKLYQLYHSIHARGENVEDVLREAAAGKLEDGDVEYDGQEVYLAEHDSVVVPGEGEPEDGEVQEDEFTPMDVHSQEAAQPQPLAVEVCHGWNDPDQASYWERIADMLQDTSSTAQPPQEVDAKTSATKETAKGGMNMPQALLGEGETPSQTLHLKLRGLPS